MTSANAVSVTWKPVAKITVSTSCTLPSAATTPPGVNEVTPLVTTSTFGCVIAGYHLFEGRMRLQPIT